MATFAPGWPGIPGRWTGSNKDGVGTALGGSPVWFTIARGILNEVYCPRIDEAIIRDLGFIITADDGFFSEEKRHATHNTFLTHEGVPSYHSESICKQGRYRLEKDFITDPGRTVVLLRCNFIPTAPGNYRIYVICASHLENHGSGNTAWTGDYNGNTGLFASRQKTSICIMSDKGFRSSSAGFVGYSDGWQDLKRNGTLNPSYKRAENGNVALTGEIDLKDLKEGAFVVALGAGRNPSEAAHLALASIDDGFDNILEKYIEPWKKWIDSLLSGENNEFKLFPVSVMVIKTHQTKYVPGAILASLVVPWGFSKGDGDLGGYHLVWPRDMVESSGGLLASGVKSEARDSLVYLEATQGSDGHWPQNMWVDGFPYWSGIQMDETAFPILFFDLAWRMGAVSEDDLARFYPMVKKALIYIVKNGPVTQQDRWEEDGGYTPFTIGAEISALVVGAGLAKLAGDGDIHGYLLDTADSWYSCIDRWLYAKGGEFSKKFGVDGYYVRINPPDFNKGDDFITIKNRPQVFSRVSSSNVVSTDALALVRFGLRRADDERILSTIKVIDSLLKVETPAGPCWRRYNGDGYGEHRDGRPFDGTGRGRLWPLLTGERAHYNVALGNIEEARRLLGTMEGLSGECGLLPEQIWDSKDIPEKGLFFGRPSGSAMPLVWAHAEYLKLARSIKDGKVFDMPPQVNERYIKNGIESNIMQWRFNNKPRSVPAGAAMRIETLSPAKVIWTSDGWKTKNDTDLKDSGLGLYYVDLPTGGLNPDAEIVFTFYWTDGERWEGRNYSVTIGRNP